MQNKSVMFTNEWKVEVQLHELDDNIQEDEILVKNHYSLISAGTELACLAGKESSWFPFPSVSGYCAVGEIIKLGKNASEFKLGDIVFYYGPHSLYNKVNVKEDLCVKLIPGLDSKYAPFARLCTVAMTAIRNSDIELGDYVAVTGMGIVGNFAAQFAQLQGGNVLAIDLDQDRLDKAKECGISSTAISDKSSLKKKIDEITLGNGIETLIEATGVAAVAVDNLPLMARGGEVILLGTPRDECMRDATNILRYVHLADNSLHFKGAHEWIYPVKHEKFVKHSFERNTRICFELIRDKKLSIDPLLTHIIKPDDAPSAYEGLKNKKNEYIGVLFNWKSE